MSQFFKKKYNVRKILSQPQVLTCCWLSRQQQTASKDARPRGERTGGPGMMLCIETEASSYEWDWFCSGCRVGSINRLNDLYI